MKKKFVLTLALVLMVAVTVSAFPVEMTGSIKAGYKLTFDPFTFSKGLEDDFGVTKPEINIDGLSVSGDFWKVAVAGGTLSFDTDNAIKGTLSIYLDKALAEQGVDMGDLTLTLSLGNKGTVSGLHVYTDPNASVGDNGYRVRQKGAYSTEVQVGYGSMLTASVSVDPTDKTNKPFQISAKSTPVDGISAAVAYTNYAENKFRKVAAPNSWSLNTTTGAIVEKTDNTKNPVDADGAIGGSVAVDVAALAGLDFGLSVSAIDTYFLGMKENYLLAGVKASYEDIAAYAEYQLFDGTSNLIGKVTFTGIENMSAYAKLTLEDLSAVATTVGFGADYTMGGVTYALDAEYAAKALSLTPSVKVSF